MTTRAEIQKWVRPFVQVRPGLALSQRAVLVAPVHHIARGMYFRSTSTKTRPEIAWFFEILFAAPGSWNTEFDRRFRLGDSTADGFLGRLQRAMQEAFENYLLPTRSVADFHDFAVSEESQFTFLNLDRYSLEHGTVLAALGRLDQAETVLRAAIAECEDAAASEQRAEDELLSTQPRPRGVIILDVARKKLRIAESVGELLAYVERRNRAAIAALLHEWERLRVEKREIGHLWEPTPFPVEEVV